MLQAGNTVLEIVQPSISNETREKLYVLLRHQKNAQRMLDEAQSDVELAQNQGQSGEREQQTRRRDYQKKLLANIVEYQKVNSVSHSVSLPVL